MVVERVTLNWVRGTFEVDMGYLQSKVCRTLSVDMNQRAVERCISNSSNSHCTYHFILTHKRFG